MRSKEIENFEAEERHNQKFRIQYKSANVKELIENPHVYYNVCHTNDTKKCQELLLSMVL